MRRKIPWLVLMLLVNHTLCLGQQTGQKRSQSHKFRTILTTVGGGGGFALGVFAGIGAYDDSINASRKVWTTALIAAAGGAIGGYFLGRALDKRETKTKVTWAPDELDRSLMRARWSADQPVELRDLKIAPLLNTKFQLARPAITQPLFSLPEGTKESN
jgi:hypothetical protein